jgi:hypothetical protein
MWGSSRDDVDPRDGTGPRPVPGEGGGLPAALLEELARCGYYPELVADVLLVALAGESALAHLVHLETTLDSDAVRRHVTVMALTPTRLITAHVDDHGPDGEATAPVAVASSESVALSSVRSVVVGHRFTSPERHRTGAAPQEVTLTVGWGTLARVDLEPAGCGDPDCEADHGYTGTVTGDDVVLRISADAEGADAVRAALGFARALSTATRPGAVLGS